MVLLCLGAAQSDERHAAAMHPSCKAISACTVTIYMVKVSTRCRRRTMMECRALSPACK